MSSHDEMGERGLRDPRPLSAPRADQSPTREELIERLKESMEVCRHDDLYDLEAAFAEAAEALRSDSQRIAELEGRLNGLSQGATVAHPSVRPDEPISDGLGRAISEMVRDTDVAVEAIIQKAQSSVSPLGGEGNPATDEQIDPALQTQGADTDAAK